MADTLILPNAVHFKEFYGGYHGTCGETALTAALICAERLSENHDQAVQLMLDITSQMRALGWADANGASTLWSLAREASTKRGGDLALEWDYAEPFPHDWHSVLLADAGYKPIVVQLANAQALPGDEAGVHYHFVCVVGRSPAGYIVMDGDNWQIEQNFVTYSYADFQAAVPCGLLVLNMKAVSSPMDSNFFTPEGNGFRCKETGAFIFGGILTFYEGNDGLTRLGLPLSNEIPVKDGCTVQVFERGAACYDPKRELDNPPGAQGDVYYAHVNIGPQFDFLATGLNKEIADLKAQIASLGNVSTYKAELASIRQFLAPYVNMDASIEALLK